VLVIEDISLFRLARTNLVGKVGLVPTMGALHRGHLALVAAARELTDFVATTIFVNPAQFAANEDLQKYPHQLQQDLDLLEQAGVDLVFTPTTQIMYPEGFQTWVDVTKITQGLEGERRPGHFGGVATVVNKLFNLTQPSHAFFGQKDAQQVAVIKQMTRDLNIPINIVVCPTVREPDGLAMSSRNVYLSPGQRQQAPIVYQALQAAAQLYDQGKREPVKLRDEVIRTLQRFANVDLDYVMVSDAVTLQEATTQTDRPLLVSTVVKMGATRLLDNVVLPIHLNTQSDLTQILGGTGWQ
jgi:pantoate--beta-alanine ligase